MRVWQPLATEGYIDVEGNYQITSVSIVEKSLDPYAGYWIEIEDSQNEG